MDFAPTKPNRGIKNLQAREDMPEPASPTKFQVSPDAPRKTTSTKRARDETGPEPGTPSKLSRSCPTAPKKEHATRSRVRDYEEDSDEWLMDSYIEPDASKRDPTWAPSNESKFQSVLHR